jgi:hypothetical protein
MPTPRTRQAARLRAHRRRAQRRARRLAIVASLGALAVVVVLVAALGSREPEGTVATQLPLRPATGLPTRPQPQALASVGNLSLQVPVAAGSVSGIGYHGSRDGALPLNPAGHQANEGILAGLWRRIVGTSGDGPVWYQLAGPPGTHVVDVGVTPGTDVYAPTDGTVVAISDIVIGGERVGTRVDIRPRQTPSLTVTVANLEPDPALTVGSAVEASSSKLGTAIDIAARERQALAEHARDGGNNVSISVYATATLSS